MTIKLELVALATGDRGAYRALLERAALSSGDSAALNAVIDPIAGLAVSGSEPALELLLDLIHRMGLARRSITGVTSNPNVVDEAAQSALIRVEQNIHRFNGESAFRTWLHTIAKNEALMILRRGRGTLLDTDELDEGDEGDAGRMSSVVASRETIERLVEALPEPYQSTLRLQLYDGMDYEQIADRQRVPIGTVRSRLAKARELLRPSLSL